MTSNDYHFVTRWRVEGTVQEVSDIIEDADGLVDWWPSVYLAVDVLEQGGDGGAGKVVALHTKGWLPYTLRWQLRVTEPRSPHGFALDAWGDFVGRGIWTFAQDGATVAVTYDWRVMATKPLLRDGSIVVRPISGVTTQYLGWCCARLAVAGKTALLLVWDNASWHISQEVRTWIATHNAAVKVGAAAVRIVAGPLPSKSPWLNPIEPMWMHGKRRVVEPVGHGAG